MYEEQFDTCDETVSRILKITEELNYLKDVDAILDMILQESRSLARADAGSIFLRDDSGLRFSYVHNETLFGSSGGVSPAVYTDFSVPIDENSIVGYVAKSGSPLVIDDAYDLDPSLPFSFNRSFDEKSGYRTRSILALPLKTFENTLVGVMQIINATDDDGNAVPFDATAQTYVPLFANNAAVAIERGKMTRELILRMMKMAEMRDPSETGGHVQRVGAYSAEIYHRWAMNRGESPRKIQKAKDVIRLAAMLHDVGKVGISDAILKKPARLTDEEFADMRRHTIFGAQLFANATSEMDDMCREIALWHHEKWAGGGYPGPVDPAAGDEPLENGTLKGEDIPLCARIVALADVYDALTSRRSYKDPWPEEKVLALIEEESGNHFDPEIVEAFFQIYDVVKAIRAKYAG